MPRAMTHLSRLTLSPMTGKRLCSVGLLTAMLICLCANAENTQPIEQRVSNRAFPSVFQAWSRADNLPEESWIDTAARHDLMWRTIGGFRLRWDASHEGLGESFAQESIANGLAYREDLLSRNPNMILLAEIRYRDAPNGYLPQDSPWWKRDAAGSRVLGWAEGEHFLLNYEDSGFQAHVAVQCKAVVDSGVVDGVLLDWWNDDHDRLSLVGAVRDAIGETPLIVVNSNDRNTPNTASYVNGLFMEVTRTSEAADWQRVAETLSWAEEHLRPPRVNCLETWFHHSRDDLHLMRATTTLSMTHSNGYCLFSDPNPLATPDHLHNWYAFWEKETEPNRPKLGKPIASRVVRPNGVVTRLFQYGMVAYNAKGNGLATLWFRRPVLSTATGVIDTKHVLNDEDGDIYVNTWPTLADVSQDGSLTVVDVVVENQ